MRRRLAGEERRVFRLLKREAREARRVGEGCRREARRKRAWEAAEALGGVGGSEGMKKEGMQAAVD